MEAFLHYIWAHRRYTKLLPQGALRGATIEVLDPGVLNAHAGPDFFAAKVRIDDLLWVGAVEIHHASSQWYQHHHDVDPAYRSVILHVVELDNRPVVTSEGESLPTCLLMVPEELRPVAPALLSAEARLACADHLPHISGEERQMWLSCLQRSRLSRKVSAVQQLLERSGGDWAQTLYALFLRALGFGLNGDALERLAFALPLHLLLKHRDQRAQVEALLLGTAGLIDYLPDEAARAERTIEYAFLAHKYDLSPLPAGTFRRARTRPTNLPEYRLLQLATLIVESDLWGSNFLEVGSMDALRTLLQHPLRVLPSSRGGADGRTSAGRLACRVKPRDTPLCRCRSYGTYRQRVAGLARVTHDLLHGGAVCSLPLLRGSICLRFFSFRFAPLR